MPNITFKHDGQTRVVDVPVGNSVMMGARDNGVPGIAAECGGACSCATCHVYVDAQWVGRIPPKDSMEEDMLDFAPAVDPERSRLSCQIKVTPELDGLVVNIPEESA